MTLSNLVVIIWSEFLQLVIVGALILIYLKDCGEFVFGDCPASVHVVPKIFVYDWKILTNFRIFGNKIGSTQIVFNKNLADK